MELETFLNELIAEGHVTLTSREAVASSDTDGARAALAELDRRARRGAPGEAPALSLSAATWAARLLRRSCQCFAFRDLEAEVIARDLAEPCPAPPDEPATHWSVDLTLRWLPDVFSIARGVADDDPLLESLRRLTREWPLSSVGVSGARDLDADAVEVVLADPCLRQLYVDRILARQDASRLGTPGVDEALRQALGLHSDLCPAFARALEATPCRKTQ